jgi:hypothetical protein
MDALFSSDLFVAEYAQRYQNRTDVFSPFRVEMCGISAALAVCDALGFREYLELVFTIFLLWIQTVVCEKLHG